MSTPEENQRKFVFYNDKTIQTNETPNHSMGLSTSKEACGEGCAKNTLCAAAVFVPNKGCFLYQNYKEADVVDLSGNFVMAPESNFVIAPESNFHTPEEESFILDLETKKTEYNAALSAYETTRNTYLNLKRKFVLFNDSSIKTTDSPDIDTSSDTKEECMDSCVKNTLCAAADFNPTTKKCSVYKTYQVSDVVDLSGNFVIAPDTLTNAVEADIEKTKNTFDSQNVDLNAKCGELINLLNDTKYDDYRAGQSKENKDFLAALRVKKDLLQKDREFIDGDLFEELFNVTEGAKRSKMTANQNFYIQVVLGVVTVVAIVATVYYLWPAAVLPGSTPVQPNLLGAQPNPYRAQPNPYRAQTNNLRRGGGSGLSNQSYFVIGGILLFSIIVSQLNR